MTPSSRPSRLRYEHGSFASRKLIEAVGLERVREPHVKHLEGKLWEIRAKGPDGIARAIYITATGRRVVILHAFVKKTQRTPKAALELSRRRAREVPR